MMGETLGKVSVSRFFFPCLESVFPSCSIPGHNGYHPTQAIKCLAFSEFEQFTHHFPAESGGDSVKMQQRLTYSPIHKYFGVLEIESKQFEQERNPSVWLRKMSFPAFSWTLLSFCLCLPPIGHLVLKAHLSQLLIIMRCICYQAIDAVQARQATGPCVPSASQSFSSMCKPA